MLDSFTRAVQISNFDDRLFDVTSSGDLRQRLNALVEAGRAADVDAMMLRQGFARTLMGADVEA